MSEPLRNFNDGEIHRNMQQQYPSTVGTRTSQNQSSIGHDAHYSNSSSTFDYRPSSGDAQSTLNYSQMGMQYGGGGGGFESGFNNWNMDYDANRSNLSGFRAQSTGLYQQSQQSNNFEISGNRDLQYDGLPVDSMDNTYNTQQQLYAQHDQSRITGSLNGRYAQQQHQVSGQQLQQQQQQQQRQNLTQQRGFPGQGNRQYSPDSQGGDNIFTLNSGSGSANNTANNTPKSYHSVQQQQTLSTGGSNAQGRALNKMLLEILRDRVVDPNRLALAIDANIERMDCVNLATLLFHTGKKRLLLTPSYIKRIAARFTLLKEELRAREASNALYGLKCMSSECAEVRQLVLAIASKVSMSSSELVAQAVGNALYGCQMMTSDYEEIRFLLMVLSVKVAQCPELLEAQNVGNALYGLRGMNSDYKEVRVLIAALTPKVATAREDLNGQALGNSLYGMQCLSSKEMEVRNLLVVLSEKVSRTWEDLKAQEVGNALYGLKRMSSDVNEVNLLLDSLVPKIAASPEILDAQAIGNSFYGMQNMTSSSQSVRSLLAVMADKVALSVAELDGQAMGNSLYGMQGMNSEHAEVRAVIQAITAKLQSSCLEMNAQELGNALYGLQNMSSDCAEVRRLAAALTQKVASSKHDLTSQEIGNALFGLQGMRSDAWETRMLLRQMSMKISQSHSLIDPQGIANSLYGMQNMSSECEEVRMMVHALGCKIEQSWKLLSTQHITNALFGMQNLSSFEVEVNALVLSLTPKVLACRDEMTAKQISAAMFGMQNLYSQHEDVRALVGAVAEKVSLCSETLTGSQLGAALFGMQGMEDETSEVRQLIHEMAVKASQVGDIDATALGNCFFGLQRMSTNSLEVCELLNALCPKVVALCDCVMHASSGLSGTDDLSAQVCSNIIYGMQNCSCAEESVREVHNAVMIRVKQIVSNMLAYQSPTNNSNNVRNKSPAMPGVKFMDVLCLYQAITLSLLNLPGLDVDPTLRDNYLEQQSILAHLVESRKHEMKPTVQQSVPELKLAHGLTTLLAKDPYIVTSGELLWGFENSVVIRLTPSVQLTTISGEEWNPVLNIEVLGSSHTFPAKDLFTRLRNRFLFEQKGVAVEMIHSNLLVGQPGQRTSKISVYDVIQGNEHLLNVLYPPTMEDASNFATILAPMGLTGPHGLLATLHEYRNANGRPHSASGAHEINFGNDYVDDNLDCSPVESRPVLPARGPRPLRAMLLHWIGEAPKVSSTANVTMSCMSNHSIRSMSAHTANPSANIGGAMESMRPRSAEAPNHQVPMRPGYGAGMPQDMAFKGHAYASSMGGVYVASPLHSSGSGQANVGFGRPLSGHGVMPMPMNVPMNRPLSGHSTSTGLNMNRPLSGQQAVPRPLSGNTSSQQMQMQQHQQQLQQQQLQQQQLQQQFQQQQQQQQYALNRTNSSNRLAVSSLMPGVAESPQSPFSQMQAPANPAQAQAQSQYQRAAEFQRSRPPAIETEDGKIVSPNGGAGAFLYEDTEQLEGSEVDNEIALLEAQLEIKRIEARLLMLKKAKLAMKGGSGGGSGGSTASSTPPVPVVGIAGVGQQGESPAQLSPISLNSISSTASYNNQVAVDSTNVATANLAQPDLDTVNDDNEDDEEDNEKNART